MKKILILIWNWLKSLFKCSTTNVEIKNVEVVKTESVSTVSESIATTIVVSDVVTDLKESTTLVHDKELKPVDASVIDSSNPDDSSGVKVKQPGFIDKPIIPIDEVAEIDFPSNEESLETGISEENASASDTETSTTELVSTTTTKKTTKRKKSKKTTSETES